MNVPVTIVIAATRYYTTLPLTIQSALNQIMLPQRILVCLDAEQDVSFAYFEQHPIFGYLFKTAKAKNIDLHLMWTGGNKGMVEAFNQARKVITTPYVWRIDDDEICEPNCLAVFMEVMADPKVGATAGLVLIPGHGLDPCPVLCQNKINEPVPNAQWFSGPQQQEVESFHSTFLYRMDASDPYSLEFSPACFREDTIFSYEIFRKGYKLVLDRRATAWHYRQEGGCRKHGQECYQRDEVMFEEYLKKQGKVKKMPDVINCSTAYGDNLILRNSLSEILPYYDKPVYIATCFPEVYKDIEGVTSIPASDYIMLFGEQAYNDTNIYAWMASRKWNKHISRAFVQKWTEGRRPARSS